MPTVNNKKLCEKALFPWKLTILPTSTTAPSLLASPTHTETLSPFFRLLATTPLTWPSRSFHWLASQNGHLYIWLKWNYLMSLLPKVISKQKIEKGEPMLQLAFQLKSVVFDSTWQTLFPSCVLPELLLNFNWQTIDVDKYPNLQSDVHSLEWPDYARSMCCLWDVTHKFLSKKT